MYTYSAAAGKTYTDLLGGTGKTISYGYGVSSNKDLLTSYNGSGTLEYDNYGNPKKWFKHGANSSSLGYTLQWGHVSNLIAITDNDAGKRYTYKYNDQGIRTEKVVNGVVHKYYLQGEQIIAERYGNNLIKFYYDTTGVCGFNYNDTDYYYQKNIQGDILRIFDKNGNLKAEYSYDAWGKCTIKSNVSNIAAINPFRYRGYYHDDETGLYYLTARYYDPEIGRFISPDSIGYLELEDINGLNIYSYCSNNPIVNMDPSGTFVLSIFLICLGVGVVVGGVLGGITAAQSGANILTGILTGMLLGGAVGAIAGLGGAYLLGGISSVLSKVVSDFISSIVSGTNSFGTWEDYSVAFVMGGLIGGSGVSSLIKKVLDVFVRPLANQVVKIGTRNADFSPAKFAYDVVSRALTSDINSGKISLFGSSGNLLKPSYPGISINFGKSLARGIFSGFGKLLFS